MSSSNHQRPQKAICHECNLAVSIRALQEGERAACPRCGYVITRAHKNAIDRMLIFSLTALIFLIMSNLFSFIHLNAQGLERDISLYQIAAELFVLEQWLLGSFLFIVIFTIPVIFAVLLSWLAIAIKLKRVSPQTIWLLRVIETLKFWNMAEIFFLGILISMIKVVSLASVFFGFSFWSYALSILFLIAAVLHFDKFQLAQIIKAMTHGQIKNTGGAVHGSP